MKGLHSATLAMLVVVFGSNRSTSHPMSHLHATNNRSTSFRSRQQVGVGPRRELIPEEGSQEIVRDRWCTRQWEGCAVSESFNLMPNTGIQVISASVTVQIMCNGQNGRDFAHQIYLNNIPEKSLIDRSAGLDMSVCSGGCAEGGFVTVLNAVPLEAQLAGSNVLHISVWTQIKHPDEVESRPCPTQKALIVKFLVSSTFTSSPSSDAQLSTILAIVWIPLALMMLYLHTHYYKKMIRREVATMRQRVGEEQDIFLHTMSHGQPFDIRPRQFKLLSTQTQGSAEGKSDLEALSAEGWTIATVTEVEHGRDLFMQSLRSSSTLALKSQRRDGRTSKTRKEGDGRQLLVRLQDGVIVVSTRTPDADAGTSAGGFPPGSTPGLSYFIVQAAAASASRADAAAPSYDYACAAANGADEAVDDARMADGHAHTSASRINFDVPSSIGALGPLLSPEDKARGGQGRTADSRARGDDGHLPGVSLVLMTLAPCLRYHGDATGEVELDRWGCMCRIRACECSAADWGTREILHDMRWGDAAWNQGGPL